MERLLLIFIVMGNVLPLLYALPRLEESFEEFDKSKKGYVDAISLENSVADVSKKSGRTIHQTAWSKENSNDEPNSLEKEAIQANSTKNINSWDLSKLLKLLLNLVHNREENKTEEVEKSGKDTGGSKNKFHETIAESSKSGSNIQKKPSENQKNNSFESKNKNAEKSTPLRSLDTYASSKLENGERSKIEHLVEELNLQESKIKESIDEKTSESIDGKTNESINVKINESIDEEVNESIYEEVNESIDEKINESTNEKLNESMDEDYYSDDDNDDNDDDEYCDFYSSSLSSEKTSISEKTLNEIIYDSYETGGTEISDKDYSKLVSETTSKLISETPTEKDSYTSINQNETMMQDEITNQETKESYDATVLSNKVSINGEKSAKKEISKQYPMHDTVSIQMQTEDNFKYDNSELDILFSTRSNEINILEIGSISPDQSVTLTTKDDLTVTEKKELQNNNTYEASSYKPLMESTVLQKISDESLISHEKNLQSTTPLIPVAVNFSTKNTEFQSQMDDEVMQELELQKTSPNTESTQSISFTKPPSLDEDFLVAKTSDTIEIREPGEKNFTSQAENYSMNNQETTQEILQSLPLSSSGEYISNTFEKDQKLPITFKVESKLSYTSEKDKQLSNTSEVDRQFSNTSEKDQQLLVTSKVSRQLSNTSAKDQQLSITSEVDKQLSNTSEKDQQLSITSEVDKQLSNTSEKDQQLSVTSEVDRQLSKTSTSEQKLSNASESEEQLSNSSEKNRLLSITSEIDVQLSNTSENDKQLSNTSESKQQLSNSSEKNRLLSNTSEIDKQLSNTSENDKQLSTISENNQQLPNISENNDQLILLETDSINTNHELSKLQNKFVENGEERAESESSNLSYTLTKIQEDIPNPLPSIIVLEHEKSQFSSENGAKDLMSDTTFQIVNKTDYQQDGLQKENGDFSTSRVTIILNNDADENLNINQSGDSLLVSDVPSNQSFDLSVVRNGTLKNMEENENDDEYYEFDVETSVSPVSENDQRSLESVKTSAMNKETYQNNINLKSEPEKQYDTILQFLYTHSNSSFIQSLRETK